MNDRIFVAISNGNTAARKEKAMDARERRALTDRYRRLLWGVTDPDLIDKLRTLIAESEMRPAEQEATTIADAKANVD